ncbi:hypothetical protein H4582DRAFT_901481 [Lactarius indigo]|nr:hypothetical protein H4582DRAFT_901481 [Lactarius indigo]
MLCLVALLLRSLSPTLCTARSTCCAARCLHRQKLHDRPRVVHGSGNLMAVRGIKGTAGHISSADCYAKSEYDAPRVPCPSPHSYRQDRTRGVNASCAVPRVYRKSSRRSLSHY